MPAKINIIGQTFGILIVTGDAPDKISPKGKILHCVFCDCGCGKTGFRVRRSAIRSGNTTSCGCVKLESMRTRSITHGHAGHITGKQSSTYHSWSAMTSRCNNPNNAAFKDYGGRGIKVCERWMDFRNFLADMGEKPAGLTIGRKNNDGNYEPDNCRWETRLEQAANTSRTLKATVRGVTGCFTQVCRHFAIKPHLVQYHIQKGVPVNEAFELALAQRLSLRDTSVQLTEQ